MIFDQWAARHAISPVALAELRALMGVTHQEMPPAPVTLKSEVDVSAAVRLEAASKGVRLWRNNVGALRDERGVPVRFGLANDSARLNAHLKSSDLIGWRPIVITAAHVGSTLAQFVSRETKAPGWTYRGGEREAAQRTWLQLVAADGGDACFTDRPGSL